MSPTGRRPQPARPHRDGGHGRARTRPRFKDWANTADQWTRSLAHPRWGVSAATRGRNFADYAIAGTSRRGKGGRPATKAHRPRWVVLGWQRGRLARLVIGFWCDAYSLDARLAVAIPPGFTLCRGCERARGRISR